MIRWETPLTVLNACPQMIRTLLRNGSDLYDAFRLPIWSRIIMGPGRWSEPQPTPLSFEEMKQRVKRFRNFLRELGLDLNDKIVSFDIEDPGQGYAVASVFRFDHLEDPQWLGIYKKAVFFCELDIINKTTAGPIRVQPPLQCLLSNKWSAEASEFMIEMIVLLLEYGADPCALTDKGMCAVVLALVQGWKSEFESALARCHIDVRHVAWESVRRVEHFENGDATSTALEASMMNRPSRKVLSRRTPICGDRMDD